MEILRYYIAESHNNIII